MDTAKDDGDARVIAVAKRKLARAFREDDQSSISAWTASPARVVACSCSVEQPRGAERWTLRAVALPRHAEHVLEPYLGTRHFESKRKTMLSFIASANDVFHNAAKHEDVEFGAADAFAASSVAHVICSLLEDQRFPWQKEPVLATVAVGAL